MPRDLRHRSGNMQQRGAIIHRKRTPSTPPCCLFADRRRSPRSTDPCPCHIPAPTAPSPPLRLRNDTCVSCAASGRVVAGRADLNYSSTHADPPDIRLPRCRRAENPIDQPTRLPRDPCRGDKRRSWQPKNMIKIKLSRRSAQNDLQEGVQMPMSSKVMSRKLAYLAHRVLCIASARPAAQRHFRPSPAGVESSTFMSRS